jgi:hypothetical protein
MNVFAQPAFIVKNPTKKMAVIKHMCMEIRPAEYVDLAKQSFEETCGKENHHESIMVLYWTHIGKFKWDTERDISVYEEWGADALSFPVSASNSQTPMAAFYGSPKYEKEWEPERCYVATIYASNSLSKKQLQTSFYFKLTSKNLEGLNTYPKKAP